MKKNANPSGQTRPDPAPTSARPARFRIFRVGRKQGRLLGLAVVILASLAMRVPWRNADPGNESFWAYGYYVTDEGYYTSGGRLSVLNGHCLDPDMNEPPTFGVARGMHYMAMLSYHLRGITFDACRWPTMLAGTAGWAGAFWLASSTTSPLVALAVTLPLSMNPLSLSYERASNSDAAMGGFLLVALCLLRARRKWPALFGGLFFAFMPAVKATGVAFAPLLLLALLAMPGRRWVRLAWGASGFALGWGVLHGFDLWVYRSHPSGLSARELRGACSMAAGSLPRPTLDQAVRALPIFPRYPVDVRLGPFAAWCLALPAWGFIAHAARGWRQRPHRPALYLGTFIFVLALGIQTGCTERYFLPLAMLAPWLLVSARASIFRWTRGLPALRAACLLFACIIATAVFWSVPVTLAGADPGGLLTNEYNLPRLSAWGVLWLPMAALVLLLAAAMAPGVRSWRAAFWAVPAAAVTVQFLWHAWPMARLGGAHSAPNESSFLVQQILLCGMFLLLAIPRRHCPWQIWYGALAAMCLAAAAGVRPWRNALPGIWHHAPQATRQVADELVRTLPADSIVLGNRASTLLRGSRLQLGFCTPNDSAQAFVGKLKRVLAGHPGRPVFLLVDEDHSYHWSYIRQAGKGEVQTRIAGAVRLPSAAGVGKPIRIFVVQILPAQP